MIPRLMVKNVALSERPVRFRTPFRFGAVTVESAAQLFVHADVDVEGYGPSSGATAELIVPKWFNKDPLLSADETVEQLWQSVTIARDLYLSEQSFDTAFGIHAARIERHVAHCAAAGIPALAACFGPAEIDKAIVDALLRAVGRDVFNGLRANVIGLDARLTADLDANDIMRFLSSREPSSGIALRHTVGMLDPMSALQEAVRQTNCRYFKLKLSGDPEADRARLATIAATLDALGVDYHVTLDANEQYADVARLEMIVRALSEDKTLASLASRLLYIEQPLPREITWDVPLGDLSRHFAFIIDEADDSYDAFPRARALGYRGVSSKACKGLYKSLLNGARAMRWNEDAADRSCVTAEDLTCQAGLAVQQDTALVAFLGILHAERNGHHYVDGFADTPPEEAEAFLAAHSDLYEMRNGRVQLAVRDGMIAVASLALPGLGSGVRPDQVGLSATSHKQATKEYGT
jgi:L-alanine-DL-glutamate epimerase-like enolase superfamily enzyme